jgi:hypothetical protein
MVIAMLAEIFMMRLEATLRGSWEMAPSSNPLFVPFRIKRKRDQANQDSYGSLEPQPDGYSTRST